MQSRRYQTNRQNVQSIPGVCGPSWARFGRYLR